jgi:protein gp37
MARRLQAIGIKSYEDGFKLTLQPDRLTEPLLRKKPSMYFVNSMSDLFHEEVPNCYIDNVFDVIHRSSIHVFQILTKRAERMYDYLKMKELPNNVWIGVTVENIDQGIPRIDYLRRIKSVIRFISMEPLLEDLGIVDLSNIDWVIVGGESGPKARPMKSEWVLNIKEQCERDQSKFFFKQWGGWGPDGVKRSKKSNGRLLLGKTWDSIPHLDPSPSFQRSETL